MLRPLLLLCVGFAFAAAQAQPLPKLALRPTFPAAKLQLPVGMEESPDGSGRFFILEQDGRIVAVTNGTDGSAVREFLNITNRQPHLKVEDGLLGLAFHPGFRSNGLFYIHYTQRNPLRSVISEWRAPGLGSADPGSERKVLEVPQPFEEHKGGQMRFGRDGMLYLALGDGGRGNDPFNHAQNTASLLGKILRIDVDRRSTVTNAGVCVTLGYAIPTDNPFSAEPEFYEYGVRKEIWAYGLRNPWRFSWDRQTGEMWAGDVGQDKWEEVDLIVKGGNYGWCVREGAHHFKPGAEGARYREPVMEYPHDPKLLAQTRFPDMGIGMCVIGGFVYRGKQYPALQGVCIYADYVLGTFWGFRWKNGQVAEHAVLLRQPKNITSLAEDHDGELYAVAYEGRIYGLGAAEP